MKKQVLYSKRAFELNASGSKKLFVGLFIHGKELTPGMILWSDKAEIVLTAQNWTTLMEKKGAVMSFFDRRNDTLEMQLDCPGYQTKLKGQPSDLHLTCFYQNVVGEEKSKFMHVAAVSYAWLFGIEKAVGHYLQILDRSLEEIYLFLAKCAECEKSKTLPFERSAHTSAGFSLSALYFEMKCYQKLQSA